jgi:hypothetical protein
VRLLGEFRRRRDDAEGLSLSQSADSVDVYVGTVGNGVLTIEAQLDWRGAVEPGDDDIGRGAADFTTGVQTGVTVRIMSARWWRASPARRGAIGAGTC